MKTKKPVFSRERDLAILFFIQIVLGGCTFLCLCLGILYGSAAPTPENQERVTFFAIFGVVMFVFMLFIDWVRKRPVKETP